MIQSRAVIHGRTPGGFALVVTITLMVLLSLLAVGLLSLSTIALRSSDQSAAMAEAQAIARLALTLAIGELQKAAGPDQRVTALADIAAGPNGARAEPGAAPVNDQAVDGTSKGLSAVQPGTRYWTGVFRNPGTPQSIFEKTPGAVVSEWLVSGQTAADRSPGNPACVVGSAGAVADATRAAVLVGFGTVGEGAGAAERCVAAPMVPIANDQRATGGLAWWVGDEGLKARLDMASTPATTDGIRLAIARRRGWETVDGFGSYPVPTGGGDEPLGRIISVPSAPLLLGELSKGAPNPLQLNFHSATVSSQGVIADTLHGGIRVDLSSALAKPLPGSLSRPVYDNDPVLGGRVIPQRAHPKLDRLRWDRLREFHQLHNNLENGSLVVSLGNGTTSMTIAPAAQGTYRAYVIDDDPAKLPFGSVRVHNLAPLDILVQFSDGTRRELKPGKTMNVKAPGGHTAYRLAYREGAEWVVQENNMIPVPEGRQTQFVVLKSDNRFFLSADGATGGYLQSVTLTREAEG